MPDKTVDVLARKVFEAYSRNSGSAPELHYDRNAAEQWMAQAFAEAGVAELIEAARVLGEKSMQRTKLTASVYTSHVMRLRAALRAVGGA